MDTSPASAPCPGDFFVVKSTKKRSMGAMEKTYKNCQSCGAAMKRGSKQSGTNADNTKSGKYCGECFQNGVFTIDMPKTPTLVK